MCKKLFTHFYTLKNLCFNLLKQLAKFHYFDKNVKLFLHFFYEKPIHSKILEKIVLNLN